MTPHETHETNHETKAKTIDISKLEDSLTENKSYCKNLLFEGIKVNHKDTPEIEGKIVSEPKQIGLNFTVDVIWKKPRKVNEVSTLKRETCFITTLVSEEIDFIQWREDQLND